MTKPEQLETNPGQRSGTWALLALAVAMAGVYWYVTRPASLPAEWQHDYAEAINAARASKKPVLAAFHSEGCPPCLQMKRSVLPASEVRAVLQQYVPVELDAWNEPSLSMRMNVEATPTFVVVSPAGRPLLKAVGYYDREEFVAFLQEGLRAMARSEPINPAAFPEESGP